MRVYVSAPIQHDPGHRAQFERLVEILDAAGLTTVNPLEIDACQDRSCGGKWEGLDFKEKFRHTHACYMKYDLQEMMHCDALVVGNGWGASVGCRAEVAAAMVAGMPVYRVLQDSVVFHGGQVKGTVLLDISTGEIRHYVPEWTGNA